MPNPGRLLSLSKVLVDICNDGYHVDLDDVQRLRDKQLILFRGPDVTAADAARLKSILKVRDSLGPKWTFPELAFFMILHGMQGVPATIVVHHIDTQVKGFLTVSERLLDRLGTGRRGRDATPVEAGMARLLSRQIARALVLSKSPDSEACKTFLQNAATVLIGAVYLNKPIAALMPYLTEAVQFTTAPEGVQAAVQYIAPRLDEWLPSLRVNWSKNQLLKDLREDANADPDAVRRAVLDSKRLLELAYRALSEVPDPDFPVSSPTNTYLFGRLVGPFPGILAAMSLQDSRDTRYSGFYSRLRSGSDFGIKPKRVAASYTRGVELLRTLRLGK